MRVALDAGHGYDPISKTYNGARGNGIQEDIWTLSFVKRLEHHLHMQGAETVLTRASDHMVSLEKRGRMARQAKCDMFISIHLNSSVGSLANGVEVFIAYGDQRSMATARSVTTAIARLGMHNRGVKWDNQGQYKSLRVLRDTAQHMRSILIEVGYLSNLQNAMHLKDPKWVEEVASAIAKTVCVSV